MSWKPVLGCSIHSLCLISRFGFSSLWKSLPWMLTQWNKIIDVALIEMIQIHTMLCNTLLCLCETENQTKTPTYNFWFIYVFFFLKKSGNAPINCFNVLNLLNRLGLIRARLAGARLARGDVLVFLDAHCEANMGWIEPLLSRIQESHNSVLVPIIDVIDAKDFHYSINGYKNFQVRFFASFVD